MTLHEMANAIARDRGHGLGLRKDRRLARKYLAWGLTNPRQNIVELRDDAASRLGRRGSGFQFGLATTRVAVEALPAAPPATIRLARVYFDRTETSCRCWVAAR